MTEEAAKPSVDWELIEKEYRVGSKTIRQIAKDHCVSHTAVQKRASRGGWVREESPDLVPPVVADNFADEGSGAGFVYVIFIEVGGRRYYKIGLARSLEGRLKSHQCSSPFDVSVAIAYFVPHMRREETVLHSMFSDQRIRGEWFDLSRDDLVRVSARALQA